MTYTEAYDKLQIILEELKNEDISLDDLKGKIKEAQDLIQYCQDKLRSIEEDLEEALDGE